MELEQHQEQFLVSKILQYGEIRKVSNIRWYASLEIIRPQVPIVAVISFISRCINNTKCKSEVSGGIKLFKSI